MSKKTKNEPQRPAPTTAHPEDELVHVPKGQSKLRFYLILALTIFVLLIFTVGSQLQGTMANMFNGGGQIRPSLVWVDPETRARHEVDQREFIFAKRALQRCAEMGLFRPRPTEASPEGSRVSDEDVAMWLIGYEKAQKAGIIATDSEVAERLRIIGFTSGDTLSRWARAQRTTAPEIQEDVRKLLAYQKYLALMQTAVAVADPDRIAELWAEQHPEYSFQYTVVDVADYEDEARQDLPADEALLAWFHALPEFRQRSYYTEDKVSPAVAYIDLAAEFDGSALLEKYPRPEDEDPETLAQSYYNQFSSIRFRNEQPDPSELEEGQEPPPLFKPFEEVREAVLREAPLQAALVDWLTDMRTREASGEEIDFAAEADALGLAFEVPQQPLSRSEIEAVPGWGGRFIAGQLAFGEQGKFLSRVVLEKSAIIVGEVRGKLPGQEPPFEEIREEVAGEWAKDHAKVIAVEKLEALRDAFGDRAQAGEEGLFLPTTDAEVFASVVTGAGLEVLDRPFLERNEVPDGDLQNASPADLFIRTNAALFELEEGQVAEAQANVQGTHAFLIRFAGERVADMDRVTPQQLQNLRAQVAYESAQDFQEKFLTADSDYARSRYQIEMLSWDTGEGGDEDY